MQRRPIRTINLPPKRVVHDPSGKRKVIRKLKRRVSCKAAKLLGVSKLSNYKFIDNEEGLV